MSFIKRLGTNTSFDLDHKENAKPRIGEAPIGLILHFCLYHANFRTHFRGMSSGGGKPNTENGKMKNGKCKKAPSKHPVLHQETPKVSPCTIRMAPSTAKPLVNNSLLPFCKVSFNKIISS